MVSNISKNRPTKRPYTNKVDQHRLCQGKHRVQNATHDDQCSEEMLSEDLAKT